MQECAVAIVPEDSLPCWAAASVALPPRLIREGS